MVVLAPGWILALSIRVVIGGMVGHLCEFGGEGRGKIAMSQGYRDVTSSYERGSRITRATPA